MPKKALSEEVHQIQAVGPNFHPGLNVPSHKADSLDIESLARIGRLHPDLLSATLDRQSAELVAFGYGQEQLWPLKQTVLAEVG